MLYVKEIKDMSYVKEAIQKKINDIYKIYDTYDDMILVRKIIDKTYLPDANLGIWNLEDKRLEQVIDTEDMFIQFNTVSPFIHILPILPKDGTIDLVSGDETIQLCNIKKVKQEEYISTQTAGNNSLQICTFGDLIRTGDNSLVVIYNNYGWGGRSTYIDVGSQTSIYAMNTVNESCKMITTKRPGEYVVYPWGNIEPAS